MTQSMPETNDRLGVLVGGTQVQDARTKRAFFSLDLLDLDGAASSPARIPLTFLAHGFSVDPRAPHIALITEKKGPGGAVVDLVKRRVLRDLAPRAGSHFYGHGVFAPDGRAVYCVETDLGSRDGALTVRDPNDFRILGEVPTFGRSPHDCVLVDAATMIVTNGGGAVGTDEGGSVAIIDVSAGRLIERVPVMNEQWNAGHLAVTSAATFAVSSAPRDGLPEKESPGGVSFRDDGGVLRAMGEPSDATRRMLGESLSVAVHGPSGVAVVTNPWGNLITIWNAREGRLLEARTMEFPRGVVLTLDGSRFAITHGKDARVGLFTAAEVAPLGDVGGGTITGSHAYVWDGSARD